MPETPDLRQQYLDAAKQAKAANDLFKQAKAALIESFGFKVADIVKPRSGELQGIPCQIFCFSLTKAGHVKITVREIGGNRRWGDFINPTFD